MERRRSRTRSSQSSLFELAPLFQRARVSHLPHHHISTVLTPFRYEKCRVDTLFRSIIFFNWLRGSTCSDLPSNRCHCRSRGPQSNFLNSYQSTVKAHKPLEQSLRDILGPFQRGDAQFFFINDLKCKLYVVKAKRSCTQTGLVQLIRLHSVPNKLVFFKMGCKL